MEPGTAFTHLDLDAGERFVPLRRGLGVTAFGLNLLLLAPGQRGRGRTRTGARRRSTSSWRAR